MDKSFDLNDNIQMAKWFSEIFISDPLYAKGLADQALSQTISKLNCSPEEVDNAIKTFPPNNDEQIKIFSCYYSFLKSVRDSS